MKKDKGLEWIRVGTLLLIALLSIPFLNMFITQVNAQATEVKIEPSTQEIGADGVPLPTPLCTIAIWVTNVTELFSWEIWLYFDSAILRYEEAWLPTGHVFDGKMIIPITPIVGSDENGSYINYGGGVFLLDDAFTGSGILCQINFTGIAPGSSALTFSETGPGARTFLLDPNVQDIDFDVTGGNITVKGISVAKEDSEITLALDWEGDDVVAGDDVIISGAITPVQGIVNVTIKYKKSGEVSWTVLANVLTDSESQYTYTWTTTENEKGTYDIKASWPGDADTWPDDSATEILTVWEGSEITLALSSEEVDVGDDVTISGAITPVQGIVNVTIKHKKTSEDSFSTLANVLTDSESQYTYTWTTTENEKGTYDIMADWPGDADTGTAYSATKRIRIGVEPTDIIPYVIAGIVAVIAIVAIVIYFVKFREPE